MTDLEPPVLFGMIQKWAPKKDVLLIAETPGVIPSVQSYLGGGWAIDCMEYEGLKGEAYSVDLNVLQDFDKQYACVMSQALLEHVCRPSVAIENMLRMTVPGGIVVLHTVNPGCGYHAFPIDCVRFFPDFWKDLSRYLPFELVWFRERHPNHFVAMRRTS
jgi:hypothetical protein